MVKNPKEVQVDLMKGLLDLVVLQFLEEEPMHGYKMIQEIRKDFGVYFGASTIYPLLNKLEEKGYLKSEWDMETDRPRKVYHLTTQGENLLNFTEDSLNYICTKIGTTGTQKNTIPQPHMYPLLKKN
jgi:DNA-binding PadR family transcriptional regulator